MRPCYSTTRSPALHNPLLSAHEGTLTTIATLEYLIPSDALLPYYIAPSISLTARTT